MPFDRWEMTPHARELWRPGHDQRVGLVERILAAQRGNPSADTSTLEREIDQHDDRLYGLAPDEIRLVEEAAK